MKPGDILIQIKEDASNPDTKIGDEYEILEYHENKAPSISPLVKLPQPYIKARGKEGGIHIINGPEGLQYFKMKE